MRTLVPVTSQLLEPIMTNRDEITSRLKQRQDRQRHDYNRRSRRLPALKEGDIVWVEPLVPGQNKWKTGKVITKDGVNSFIVEIGGKRYRRNRVNLRLASQDFNKDETYMEPIISDEENTDEETVNRQDNEEIIEEKIYDETTKTNALFNPLQVRERRRETRLPQYLQENYEVY